MSHFIILFVRLVFMCFAYMYVYHVYHWYPQWHWIPCKLLSHQAGDGKHPRSSVSVRTGIKVMCHDGAFIFFWGGEFHLNMIPRQ